MTKDSAVVIGTQEDANSESSVDETGQQGSRQPEYVTVEQFQEIQRQLQLIQRIAQGDKDRAVRKTNERVDGLENDLKKVLQRASQEGKSANDVLTEIRQQEEEESRQLLAQMAKAWKDGRFPQAASQGSEAKGEVDVLEVIADFGLDPEDKRVAALATRSFETIEAAEQAVVDLVKRMNKRPAPSNAERPSREGEASRQASNQEKLLAEYNQKAVKLRGLALVNLKMEYRRKGLDIS